LRCEESGTSSTIIELVEFGLRDAPPLSGSGSLGAFHPPDVASNAGPDEWTGVNVKGSSSGEADAMSSGGCDAGT
jgi:hypothetical protein